MARSSEKEYVVVGPHAVMGHQTGEKFKATFTTDREVYFLKAGHLKVYGGKAAQPEPELKCEACAEHGSAAEKKATYKSLESLREHYQEEHPALAAPTE